jgi:hypothetical protein
LHLWEQNQVTARYILQRLARAAAHTFVFQRIHACSEDPVQ